MFDQLMAQLGDNNSNPWNYNNFDGQFGSEGQFLDQRALRQNTMGTPNYQGVQGFTPDWSIFNDTTNNGQQGYEISRLLDKYKAVNGKSQQEIASSGFSPWSNEDAINLARLSNTLPDQMRRSMNELTNRQIQAGAWALQDDPNASGFDKEFGSALMSNKTFANVVGSDPLANFNLPMGNQLNRKLHAWDHRLGDNAVSEDLNKYSNARDYLYDVMDQMQGGGGWKSDGLGYNSMGMGNDFGPVVGGDDNPEGKGLWGDLGQASGFSPVKNQDWGNGPSKPNIWGNDPISHPYIWGQPENSPAPPSIPQYKNNSLLKTGGDGINEYAPGSLPPGTPWNPYSQNIDQWGHGSTQEPWGSEWGSGGIQDTTHLSPGQQYPKAYPPYLWGWQPPGSQTGTEATLGGMPRNYSPDTSDYNSWRNNSYAGGNLPNHNWAYNNDISSAVGSPDYARFLDIMKSAPPTEYSAPGLDAKAWSAVAGDGMALAKEMLDSTMQDVMNHPFDYAKQLPLPVPVQAGIEHLESSMKNPALKAVGTQLLESMWPGYSSPMGQFISPTASQGIQLGFAGPLPVSGYYNPTAPAYWGNVVNSDNFSGGWSNGDVFGQSVNPTGYSWVTPSVGLGLAQNFANMMQAQYQLNNNPASSFGFSGY